MGVENLTRDELLSELVDLVGDHEPDGEGWFTVNELAEQTGYTQEKIRCRIKALVRKNKAEAAKIGSRWFYRVKK